MELEVKAIGGINNCFVSLPLPLIQTLQSTRSAPLPQILALELRSPTHPPHLWFVAWSGATSASSSTIEVSQQFAECILLPNHARVQVRAASNVPHASLVTIEPHTEDDWEILELNSDQAEAAILNQLPMAHDIDLATVANMTEGFSGADLQALLSDAQLAAVHDVLDNVDASGPEKILVITDAHLKSTASKARPSVSEEEKRRLYSIYHQFLDSKRSVAAQSSDAKGKRATLA